MQAMLVGGVDSVGAKLGRGPVLFGHETSPKPLAPFSHTAGFLAGALASGLQACRKCGTTLAMKCDSLVTEMPGNRVRITMERNGLTEASRSATQCI